MKVVISGSFRKHLQGILKLKREFEERGIEVIKPNRVRTINNIVRAEGKDFIRVNQKRQKGCVLLTRKNQTCYY